MRLEDAVGVIEATSGIAPEGSRWPLDDDVRAAIAAGRPIQVTTAGAAVAEALEPYTSAYGHALVSPMRFSGAQLGIIVLGRHQGRPSFSPGDIAAMQQFATMAALVLHNGRLVHRLREAETMKSEFMNIAVHELRGPLTVVEGYADLLLDEPDRLDPAVAEQIATIRRQAAHARGLAGDLLILARLESDDLGVAAQPVSLRGAVDAAVERAQPRARLQGASSIEVRVEEDVTAVGDRQLIERILGNLLANAIAYAYGPIRVTVAASEARATVRVEDAGPGIPGNERETVFARFARGARARGVQGSGLGLYLSRECARRMDGDLVLESAARGPGSRFVLSLPRASRAGV
jgi:signal transduction histidine kinase